ncbi:MAG: hypothetical protein R3C40_01355 [Parvularculaceae bacterium]
MRISVLLRGAGLVVTLAAAVVVSTLYSFNHFRAYESRFDGRCEPVAGVDGAEDLQFAPSLGKVFLSSLDPRKSTSTRGEILAISVSDPLAADNWRDRTAGQPAKFRPLGVSYFEDGDVRRLFVVNDAGKSVEIFDVVESGDLEHVETISERRLTSPNAIVAVGPRSFYVSNDVASGRDSLLGRLQFVVRIASGEIFYFEGGTMRSAATGLRFANGVAVSADGKQFFVAETAGQTLAIFDRDPLTGVLRFSKSLAVDMAIDNINLAEDGALWIAGTPKPLSIPGFRHDPSARLPSIIYRYEPGADALNTVMIDDGAAISAATAAAPAGDKLFVGALLENKYLICDLPTR